MQLPRGSFHSIKRGILLDTLLDEMEKSGFSGYCTISLDAISCSLVLHSGNYILAEYGKTEGDAAWLKISDLITKKVDAALTDLSDAQLKLCLEFNAPAEILEPVRRVRHETPVKSVLPNVRSEALAGQESRHARTTERKGKSTGAAVRAPKKVAIAPNESIRNPQPVENDEAEIFDRDIGALDDLDLDEMTRKIRENCVVTVEKLHLEHLIQKTS
ncbi:MAG TPA: hypothetical protein VMC42_01270 [Methanoregulaceae archaeon]|nr:hypothetical protein [Methanoregulaceae archaeon]